MDHIYVVSQSSKLQFQTFRDSLGRLVTEVKSQRRGSACRYNSIAVTSYCFVLLYFLVLILIRTDRLTNFGQLVTTLLTKRSTRHMWRVDPVTSWLAAYSLQPNSWYATSTMQSRKEYLSVMSNVLWLHKPFNYILTSVFLYRRYYLPILHAYPRSVRELISEYQQT